MNQTAVGGNGGIGTGGAGGNGGGATSTLTFTRASGTTTTATMAATGGNGANASLGGTPGTGANSTSSLSLTGAAAVTSTVNATGGNGGSIVAGSLGSGSNGGTAAATAMATSTGVGAVGATATAVGGNGGNASSGAGGLGGNTTATATSVGSGAANSTATADGGNGSVRSTFGSGVALASATGTSGSAAANALSAGGMLINLESHATAPVNGLSRASARAGIATTAMDAATATGLEAAAFTTGLPTDIQALSLFGGNGSVKNNFNIATDSVPGATSDLFGLATFGGSNTEGGSAASRTFTSSATYAIDLTGLSNPRQDLLLGLLDTNSEGIGFDSLNFQISREGVVVVNQTFLTVADAVNFLDGKTLNLGSNAVANVSGNLDLVFTTTLITNDAGAGFYFDLAFGNSTLDSGSIAGDYDRDGDVDAADYSVWKSSYGSMLNLNADGNKNGTVDAADYTVWRNNSGTNIGMGEAPIPEPATLVILVIGLITVGLSQPSRGRQQ